MLATDAMPVVGNNERQILLHGGQITLHENRLTGPDGTLAGAHLTMIEAVRNAVTLLKIPLSDALVMGSRTPAGIPRLGIGAWTDRARISRGFVAFNHNFEVFGTWVDGMGTVGRTEIDFNRGEMRNLCDGRALSDLSGFFHGRIGSSPHSSRVIRSRSLVTKQTSMSSIRNQGCSTPRPSFG